MTDLDILVGLLCWQCIPGVGTCFTAELGTPRFRPRDRYGTRHRCVELEGSVGFWAYLCDWKLKRDGAVVGCGDDPHDVMADRLVLLQGSRVRRLSYAAPAWRLELDSGYAVEMTEGCATGPDAVAHVRLGDVRWCSLMPDGRVEVGA